MLGAHVWVGAGRHETPNWTATIVLSVTDDRRFTLSDTEYASPGAAVLDESGRLVGMVMRWGEVDRVADILAQEPDAPSRGMSVVPLFGIRGSVDVGALKDVVMIRLELDLTLCGIGRPSCCLWTPC